MTGIAKYMTAGPHTIGREQSLGAAKQLMHRNHVRHLPVLHAGQLVGMLSLLMGLLAELVIRTYYESQNKRPYLVAEELNRPSSSVQLPRAVRQ